MGIASSVVQYQAQRQDFQSTRDAWQRNVISAFAAARDEQSRLTLRQLQEADATSQKVKLSQLKEAEAKAEAQVAAAASGVSGLSVDALLADIGRTSAFNRQAERRNFAMTAEQIAAEKRATIIRAQARIAGLPYGTPPNPATLALGIAGAGFRGLTMAEQRGLLD